jgi:hypothetical protein
MNMTPARNLIAPKLRTLPIFADLDEEAIETLAGMVTYRQVPKGAFIVTQHERGGCMFLLVSGRVKVSLASPDGKELALSYLEAPAHFGEMSLVDSEPRSADVIAVTDVEALALEAKDLSAAIQLQPRLALSLIAPVASHDLAAGGHGVPRRDPPRDARAAQRRDRGVRVTRRSRHRRPDTLRDRHAGRHITGDRQPHHLESRT